MSESPPPRPVEQWPRPAATGGVSFDIDFAHAFLHAHILDGVADFIAQTRLYRHRIDQDERRRDVRRVDLHIFQTAHPRPKGLSRFQVFYSIKLERIGHFIENAFGYFE